MAISEKKLDSFLSNLKKRKEEEKERELMLADDDKSLRKSGSFNYDDNILGGSETSPLQRESIKKMFNNPDRLARKAKNMALIRKLKEARDKQDRWAEKGSGYEAMSDAGEKRAEAERIRYNKMVDPEWKPSDDTWTGRQKILRNMDARNKALDPENDPGFLSSLRNKFNISPTNAEVERRLRARNNAREEEARLHEGEAEGAIAGTASERIRQARDKAMMARLDKIDPSGPETHRKYEADYEKFDDLAMDEASEEQFIKDEKNAEILKQIDQEYDKRGIGEVQGYSPEQKAKYKRRGQEGIPLSELEANQAGRIQNRRERIKWNNQLLGMGDPDDRAETGHMRNEILPGLHKKQYGKTKEDTEMSELDRIAEQDQQLKDLASARPTMLEEGDERSMKSPLGNWKKDSETLEEEAIDQASEMQTIDDSFPSFEGDERAARRVQEDMQNMSDDEKNEVVKVVQDTKGKQSEEAIAAKEATGDYVRYEGTGFVINKRALDKAFDRQEKMELLQHIPQANRAAMLFNWKFIDQGDLDTAQKQSAKDIKELTLLDSRIKESELKIAAAGNKLGEADKLKYQSHSTGFRQAVKDGDWETAEYFHSQMNSLLPKGSQDNVDFAELKKKQEKRLRKKTPSRIFQDAGLGKDGKAYYDSVDGIMKKVNFIKNSTNKGSEWDRIMSHSLPTATGEGVGTYGEFLKTQGIYSWKDMKSRKITPEQISKMPGITEDALDSEEAYMSWALPKIQNKLALGIWGNVHTDVQRALGILKKKTIEEAQKTVNTPAGLKEKQLKPKVTKPIKKKIKPKPKSEPEVVETNKKETEGLGDLSMNEKSRLRPHRHSSSAGRTKYNDLTKRINRMEKYIKDNKSALSPDEIKDRNKDIEMLKLRASQFKEKWEESEQKIKEELESIKLQRELKAYNKKRVAEGFKALRYPEYQKLKREGKIK